MRSSVAAAVWFLTGPFCTLAATAEKPADEGAAVITILHVNDSHGRYMPFEVVDENATAQTGDPGGPPERFERQGLVGGFACLASAVKQIRQERGRDKVLLVHAGDAFSDDLLGNLTRGETTICLMNALAFDFLALGNHDFDYGQERTRELQKRARFPLRGANIIDQSTGKPFLGEPSHVFVIAGVRVGLLALGYHHTSLTTNPRNVPTLKFIHGIDAAQRYLPDLASRSDLVVVVSHLGSRIDQELARQVEGIDLIIGGHSHDTLTAGTRVGDTWLAQSRSDLAVLGEVKISMAKGKIDQVEIENHVLWNDRYQPDAEFQEIVEALRRPYRERLEEVLTTATATIGRNYMSESPFDVLVGQFLREATGAEVAMLPGIGYGISLTPGPVTREELYTLLPHPAKVATVRLTGAQVVEILEQSASNIAPDDPAEAVGGLIQTSGIEWAVDLTKPVGNRISQAKIAGRPVRRERQYLVATHNGMLHGLHRYGAFQQGTDRHIQDQPLVELVEGAFHARDQVSPPPLGHVRLTK